MYAIIQKKPFPKHKAMKKVFFRVQRFSIAEIKGD